MWCCRILKKKSIKSFRFVQLLSFVLFFKRWHQNSFCCIFSSISTTNQFISLFLIKLVEDSDKLFSFAPLDKSRLVVHVSNQGNYPVYGCLGALVTECCKLVSEQRAILASSVNDLLTLLRFCIEKHNVAKLDIAAAITSQNCDFCVIKWGYCREWARTEDVLWYFNQFPNVWSVRDKRIGSNLLDGVKQNTISTAIENVN